MTQHQHNPAEEVIQAIAIATNAVARHDYQTARDYITEALHLMDLYCPCVANHCTHDHQVSML